MVHFHHFVFQTLFISLYTFRRPKQGEIDECIHDGKRIALEMKIREMKKLLTVQQTELGILFEKVTEKRDNYTRLAEKRDKCMADIIEFEEITKEVNNKNSEVLLRLIDNE